MEQEEEVKTEWERHRADWYHARQAFLTHLLIYQVAGILNDTPPQSDKKVEDFLIDFEFEEWIDGSEYKQVLTSRSSNGRTKSKDETPETPDGMVWMTDEEYEAGLAAYCAQEKAVWAGYFGLPTPTN
jgi:hypothetical protein